jgi:ribosome maturation protein SDO1
MPVSLDKAITARLEKAGMHFEVLVDPAVAMEIKEGIKPLNPLEHLAIDKIFKDVKTGDHAADENLTKVFGTTDVTAVATKIIRDGEVQLTTEQRHKMQADKRKRIVQEIVRNAWNPQTKTPHPAVRIEAAMDEAKVHVDAFKSVESQVKDVIAKLKVLIPIAFEKIKVAVKIPAQYSGSAYGQARSVGDLIRDEWQADGSWIGVIEIPAGMQTELYDVLNKATHGQVETKILK